MKHLFSLLLTLVLSSLVWLEITIAVGFVWALTVLAFLFFFFAIVGLKTAAKEVIAATRKAFDRTSLQIGVATTVWWIFTLYMTGNIYLLWAYTMLVLITWTFIYKLFTTEGKQNDT